MNRILMLLVLVFLVALAAVAAAEAEVSVPIGHTIASAGESGGIRPL